MLRKTNSPDGQPTTAVPEAVGRIAEIMSTYSPPWALCGGWAVDAWLRHSGRRGVGRLTRDHEDVDIAVFDQRALFEHLAGWQLIGHEGGK